MKLSTMLKAITGLLSLSIKRNLWAAEVRATLFLVTIAGTC